MMDRPEQPQVPVAPPPGATALFSALTPDEWNFVLSCVAKGPIETHIGVFMKLRTALESEMKKGQPT